MKQFKSITVFFILLGWSALAQEAKKGTYSFTLKQAISHALQNNTSVVNANRDIESARQKKWETTASGLPQINGSFDFMDNIQIQRSGLPAATFNPQAAPGEIVAVGFGLKYNANAKVTLQQLIFDGSYLVALKASKTFLEYSQNAKLKTESDVKEMIVTTYGNVLLAEETILVLEKNKINLEKNQKEITEIFKNGLTEEENVEQITITLATVTSALNYSKRVKEVAHKMLKIALGLNLEDELKLTDTLENVTQDNLKAALVKETFNLTNTIDYKMVENNKEKERLLLLLEKRRMLPTLGAFANFGYNSFNNEFKFLSAEQRWYDYSAIGASLQVPIFSSFKSGARIQQAKIALEANTLVDDTSKQLKLAFEKASSDYEYSIEQYATSKSNLNLAQRIEAKQQIKFKEGLSSSFEFTEAQRQMYSEQQNYLRAMLDVLTKRAALEKITNK